MVELVAPEEAGAALVRDGHTVAMAKGHYDRGNRFHREEGSG